MKLPQIEINGVTYTMKKPKANMWGKFAKFDAERTKGNTAEYVDKVCEFLAEIFDGVTKDDLLDNLYLEEVQKKYFECSDCFWSLLTGKFEELEKNSETAENTAVVAQI